MRWFKKKQSQQAHNIKPVQDLAYANPSASIMAAHQRAKALGRPALQSPLRGTPFSNVITGIRSNRGENAASFASSKDLTKALTSGPEMASSIQKIRPKVKLTSDMFKPTVSPHPRHPMRNIHASTALDDQKVARGRIVAKGQVRHRLGRATALSHRKISRLAHSRADERLH